MPGQGLRRPTGGDLAGLFDNHSTVAFDPTALMTTADLSSLGPSHPGIQIAQTCASVWIEATVRDPRGGKRWVVHDEGWSMLTHGPLLARMQEQWKLSRARGSGLRAQGLSNWIIAHRCPDFDAAGESDSRTRHLARGMLADTDTDTE